MSRLHIVVCLGGGLDALSHAHACVRARAHGSLDPIFRAASDLEQGDQGTPQSWEARGQSQARALRPGEAGPDRESREGPAPSVQAGLLSEVVVGSAPLAQRRAAGRRRPKATARVWPEVLGSGCTSRGHCSCLAPETHAWGPHYTWTPINSGDRCSWWRAARSWARGSATRGPQVIPQVRAVKLGKKPLGSMGWKRHLGEAFYREDGTGSGAGAGGSLAAGAAARWGPGVTALRPRGAVRCAAAKTWPAQLPGAAGTDGSSIWSWHWALAAVPTAPARPLGAQQGSPRHPHRDPRPQDGPASPQVAPHRGVRLPAGVRLGP